MPDDVTPDADDDNRTVTDGTFAAPSEPVVDPEVPSGVGSGVSRDEINAAEDAEAVTDDPATEQEIVEALGAHDPSVEVPADAEPAADLPEQPSSRAKPPDVHVPSGPDKGTFRGHAAVEADRQAAEAALVAARPPVA